MTTVGCPNGKRLFTYQGYIMRTYCGSWHCPVCRRKLAHYWAQNVYYGACLWRPMPLYFLTFTMPGWFTSPAQGYKELPKCWDTFRKLAGRQYRWFTYAAFAEEQSKNRAMIHLHVITTCNLPTRLNEIALHCGFGFESKNEIITGIRAAFYVTKYASKSLPNAPTHFRRVRISQTWPRLPEPILPEDYIPQRQREPLKDYIMRCSAELGIATAELTELYDNLASDLES